MRIIQDTRSVSRRCSHNINTTANISSSIIMTVRISVGDGLMVFCCNDYVIISIFSFTGKNNNRAGVIELFCYHLRPQVTGLYN
jgi:hypothetical protein